MSLEAPRKNAVVEDLTRLPDLYVSCFHEITVKRSALSPVRVRRPRNPHQFNEDAMEVRNEINDVLLSWARLAAEAVGSPLPQGGVGALVTFLVAHLDWLTSFTAAPEFAAEVAGLRVRAEQLTEGDNTPQLHDLGPCVETACEGRLTARPVPGRSAASTIVCDLGHTWQPREWLLLSARLGDQESS